MYVFACHTVTILRALLATTTVIINRFYYRLTSENDQNPNLYHLLLGNVGLEKAISAISFCWASFYRFMFYLFIFYSNYNLKLNLIFIRTFSTVSFERFRKCDNMNFIKFIKGNLIKNFCVSLSNTIRSV